MATKAPTTARKAPARKVPADHLKKADEVKRLKDLPAAKYFRPLEDIDPIDALDVVEALEGMAAEGEEPSIASVKAVARVVSDERFIVDMDVWRRELWNAAHMTEALEACVAFAGELGKGMN